MPPEEKTPVIETTEEKTPVSGEKEKGTTPDPGAEGKGDETFIEVEGMGKVRAQDVKGLKTAQIGLEKERNDLRARYDELEKKVKEAEDKNLSEEEKFRKELAEERKSLLDDKISLELEKAGIIVDKSALNLGVTKLSEVSPAVAAFALKYPGLVKKEVPAKPETPAPAGGSPGESPPGLDKMKEWETRLKAAEISGDLKEVRKIEAEYNAYRGRESTGGGVNTL